MDKGKKKEEQQNEQAAPGAERCEQPTDQEQLMISGAEFKRLTDEAKKAQENWDKYVRLHADIENTRKRWERERQELVRYANEGLLADLLNVNDDLERTLRLSQEKHEDFEAFMKGVEMILAHLHDLLKKNGITPMEAEGKKFDPNLHEALMTVEKADVPDHTVVEELQKGYMIDNHVLRTAKVKVSHATAEKPADAGCDKSKSEEGTNG
jgi:molecular chaperone GrpE